MMSFTKSIKTCFFKYFDFNGRASRSEFWWFIFARDILMPSFFFLLGTNILTPSLFYLLGTNILIPPFFFLLETKSASVALLFGLSTLIPLLAVMVRRLHDSGRSGWWGLTLVFWYGFYVSVVWILGGGPYMSYARNIGAGFAWAIIHLPGFIFFIYLMCRKSKQ